MKKALAAILLSLFAFIPFNMSANQQIDLSDQQKEEIRTRVNQKIEAFLLNLTYIANADKEIQDNAIKATLALFLGNGGPYTLYDVNDNPTSYNGVTMQTLSARKDKHGRPVKPRPILMRRYLDNLRGMPYNKVEIIRVGVIYVDQIEKVDDGRYQAIGRYSQEFSGYQDGRLIYRDRTSKIVKTYIDYIDDGSDNGYWNVLLGDMCTQVVSKTN
jgi:hypothetical protein